MQYDIVYLEQKNILIRHAYLWHAATVLTKLSFVYHAKIACLCHHHYAGNPVEGHILYTPKTVGASSEYPATVFKHSKVTFFCHSARCSLGRYNKRSWGGHLFEDFKVLCWHHVCISFCSIPVFIRTKCKGIQDSLGFWILCCGFQISCPGFQSLSVGLGFGIPIVSVIPHSLWCISDS